MNGSWTVTRHFRKRRSKGGRVLHSGLQSPRKACPRQMVSFSENVWWWQLACVFLIKHHLPFLTSSRPPLLSTPVLNYLVLFLRMFSQYPSQFPHLVPFLVLFFDPRILEDHSEGNSDHEQWADLSECTLIFSVFISPPPRWLFLPCSFSIVYLPK
jgi:hypothetical protein